jgi:DNA polymerase I-like protein with 3'-5' exonuclease and polymerase domains
MSLYYYGFENASPTERFRYWQENRPQAISLDVETVSLENRRPLGFGIAFSPYEAFYFDLYDDTPPELEYVKKWLEDIRIVKLGHNLMFDLGVFPLIPVVGESLKRTNIWDTNVAARLLGNLETSLPILCEQTGVVTIGMGDILKKYGVKDNIQLMEKAPMALAEHCQADVRATYALYLKWKDEINEKYGEYFNIEMQALPIILDVSMKGLLIDETELERLTDRYEMEVDALTKHVQSFGIEKPGSPYQVAYKLSERGNFLPQNWKTKSLITDKSALEFLDDPLAEAVLTWRKKSKFSSTYLRPLLGENRFFTEYYFDTGVGRLNSRNRNIQNWPEDARYVILPNRGIFTTGDYSREHLYILANKSQDRDLLKVLYDPDPRKTDLHQYTADRMSVPRSLAKTLNFAVVYGATAKTVSEQAKIRDIDRCQKLIDSWFKVYRGAYDWIQQVQEEGVRSGWAVPTLFGRRIKLPDESLDGKKRKAVNYPILGSDGEVFKRAVVLSNKRGLGPEYMAIFVHDSITWDGDVKRQIPVEELEHIPGFRIPFDIKQTFRWE